MRNLCRGQTLSDEIDRNFGTIEQPRVHRRENLFQRSLRVRTARGRIHHHDGLSGQFPAADDPIERILQHPRHSVCILWRGEENRTRFLQRISKSRDRSRTVLCLKVRIEGWDSMEFLKKNDLQLWRCEFGYCS